MRGFKTKAQRAKLIKGPGTGVSDSIQTTVPEGTYIMPTDTTQALGFHPERQRSAPVNVQGRGFGPTARSRVPVNVSNGEMEIPPEAVSAIGAQVLSAVRDQTHDFSGRGYQPGKAPARQSQQGGRGYRIAASNEHPQQYFRNGGLVEDERKRNSFSDNSAPGRTSGMMQPPATASLGQPQPAGRGYGPTSIGAQSSPVGMMQTSDQQAAQRRAQHQQGMADRINTTRQNVGSAVDAAGNAIGTAYGTILNTATTVPRAIANTTFDDRLPGQDIRDRKRSEANAKWVNNNPDQALAGQQFGQDVADRAVTRGYQPRGGYPGIGQPMPQQPDPVTETPEQPQPAGRGYGPTSIAAQSIRTEPSANLAPNLEAAVNAKQPDPVATNNVIRDGNSFSANTPIGRGYSVNGQRSKPTNTYSGRDAMQSNLLAAQIHQQTRLENSNPNYLNVVRDSGRSGIQGELNRRENKALEERQSERKGQHQQRVQQGQQQLNQAMQARQNADFATEDRRTAEEDRQFSRQQATQQQEWAGQDREWMAEDREFTRDERQRLADLQARITDQSLSVPERMQARREYQALTVNPKDRYKTESVQFGTDQDGKPILGNRLVDVTTGEYVSGEMPSQTATPALGEVRGGYRFKGGSPADQNNWERV